MYNSVPQDGCFIVPPKLDIIMRKLWGMKTGNKFHLQVHLFMPVNRLMIHDFLNVDVMQKTRYTLLQIYVNLRLSKNYKTTFSWHIGERKDIQLRIYLVPK